MPIKQKQVTDLGFDSEIEWLLKKLASRDWTKKINTQPGTGLGPPG